MITGEISIVNVGNDVSIDPCGGGNVYELRIGSMPIVFINQEQAYNLKVALNQMFPSKVIVQNRLPIYPYRG